MRGVIEAECVLFAGGAGLPRRKEGSVLISRWSLRSVAQRGAPDDKEPGESETVLLSQSGESVNLDPWGGSSTLAISEMKLVFWTQRVLE